jgi:hypothetical protein
MEVIFPQNIEFKNNLNFDFISVTNIFHIYKCKLFINSVSVVVHIMHDKTFV